MYVSLDHISRSSFKNEGGKHLAQLTYTINWNFKMILTRWGFHISNDQLHLGMC